MKTIASFTVDHTKLLPGVYVSRKDTAGDTVVTTFDIRMTAPNREPVMNTAEIHTIEHLGATFLRNHEEWADRILYFGPMGCRTGWLSILQSVSMKPYCCGSPRNTIRTRTCNQPIFWTLIGYYPGKPLKLTNTEKGATAVAAPF